MKTKTIEKSSNIKEIGYDGETRELTVTFVNKSQYAYADVPPEIFEDFALAESAGRFFHQKVKGKFEYRKLDVEDES